LRAPFEHDEGKVRRDLLVLADQLAADAKMLRRVFRGKHPHTVDRTGQHFGKQRAGFEQQCFDLSRRMLPLDEMEIENRHFDFAPFLR
jgi:hypothetical protein